jgi:hypothetical protein
VPFSPAKAEGQNRKSSRDRVDGDPVMFDEPLTLAN